jgi:hypothetical protein
MAIRFFYFLKGSVKQSCIKSRIFLFLTLMAGSELAWLASGYSQGVENGLLDEVSSSDMAGCELKWWLDA